MASKYSTRSTSFNPAPPVKNTICAACIGTHTGIPVAETVAGNEISNVVRTVAFSRQADLGVGRDSY